MDDQGWSQKTPGLNHRFFVCFYQNDPNLKISFLSLRIRGSGKQEFLCGKSRYEVGEVSLKLDNLSNNYNLEFDFIACWTCENCHVNLNSKFQFSGLHTNQFLENSSIFSKFQFLGHESDRFLVDRYTFWIIWLKVPIDYFPT